MGRGAWRATVHGVTESWTGLNSHAYMCRDSYEEAAIPNTCRGRALWGKMLSDCLILLTSP